jgi:hypothetical protein
MLNPSAGETPDWRRRWSLLLAKIERVQSPAQGQALLDELSRPRAPSVLAFANAHAMNSMAVSAPFFEAMQSADRVLRDGSGMATLFRMLRMEPGLNLNGTDLIPKLMRAFDGRGIALFGTREPWLEKAWLRVRQELAPHSTVIRANGFLDAQAYAQLAAEHRPALIVLGMGMPRQEASRRPIARRARLPVPDRLRWRHHRFPGRQDAARAAVDAQGRGGMGVSPGAGTAPAVPALCDRQPAVSHAGAAAGVGPAALNNHPSQESGLAAKRRGDARKFRQRRFSGQA